MGADTQPTAPAPHEWTGRVDEVVAALRAAGCVFAEEEAALLRAEAATHHELARMLAQRVGGSPLEPVVGWAEFDGLRIRVSPGVFVPRRRTAWLVELAAPMLEPGQTVVDLCCGTGAVGAALAARVPGLQVFAADVDPGAVGCARGNLSPEQVFEGDLYAALPDELRDRVDALVVNAPYVPSREIRLMPPEARDHEPSVALDGGVDGLAVVRRVVGGAAEWLRPGGTLVVETSRSQAAVVLGLFAAAGFMGRVECQEEWAATAVVGRHGH